MIDGKTLEYVVNRASSELTTIQNNFSTSVSNFSNAKPEEQIWIVVRTMAIAIACGLITTAIVGSAASTFVSGMVIGGLYAFYNYNQPSVFQSIGNTVGSMVSGAAAYVRDSSPRSASESEYTSVPQVDTKAKPAKPFSYMTSTPSSYGNGKK